MIHALDERFLSICRTRGSAPAVHDLADARTFTFDQLYEWSISIRRALEAPGIGPGTTIIALVGNHPIFFPLLAACMSAGLAVIPLGETTDEEATAVIASSGAGAVVTDRALPLTAATETPIGDDVRLMVLPPAAGAARYGESVVLKLTSGSTDVPKAAVAAIEHLMHDGDHVVEAMGIEAGDVNFACIPLSHSYALGNVVMPLLMQGTAVALRQSFHPVQCIGDIAATGATVFPAVPFMFDRLRASAIERLPAQLRLLITAGAKIDPATVRWFRETTGRKVHSFYGSSETGGIAYDDSLELHDPLHVGHPMPETSIAIREPNSAGVGRVFVSGTAVAKAYASNRVDDSSSGFVDGGFLTGDLGYADDSDRLVLTGRVSTTVNVAGLKVDPAEVERVLMEMPGVADVRVMGASCDHRGQQLVAFVVSDRTMTPVDLRQGCARTLSPHKIPRQFIFLDEIPVDARGKMDRRALEALAEEAPA